MPLAQLLKKGCFQWSDSASQAFEELKKAMVKAHILGLLDFSIPFTVEVDASGCGVGAVLMQNGRGFGILESSIKPKTLGHVHIWKGIGRTLGSNRQKETLFAA